MRDKSEVGERGVPSRLRRTSGHLRYELGLQSSCARDTGACGRYRELADY